MKANMCIVVEAAERQNYSSVYISNTLIINVLVLYC